MRSKTFILSTLIICTGICCNRTPGSGTLFNAAVINDTGKGTGPHGFIKEIPLPDGFKRIKRAPASFGWWLENLPLKHYKTVYLFNGKPKPNQTAQFAVLAISVGKTDLQQCADAVMRLRAEYLFSQKRFRDIHFTDNSGTTYQFHEPYNYINLQHYLRRVFGMCGSASLAKQLSSVSLKDIDAGDVIIKGGFPGHAVIVMDLAINSEGKKIYQLAQSYMPAQDIHILVNPMNKILSPWYPVNEDEMITTPEYIFKRADVKRW